MLLILLVIKADILLGVMDRVVIAVCLRALNLVSGGLYVEVSVGPDGTVMLVSVGSCTVTSVFLISSNPVGVTSTKFLHDR